VLREASASLKNTEQACSFSAENRTSFRAFRPTKFPQEPRTKNQELRTLKFLKLCCNLDIYEGFGVDFGQVTGAILTASYITAIFYSALIEM
jgi:hypothetical protein